MVPALRSHSFGSVNDENYAPSPTAAPTSTQLSRVLLAQASTLCKTLSNYFNHSVFLPSIALCLLYLTVLSFSGQMVTYLVSLGFTSTHIGLLRTVSVAFEISATWLAPIAMNRVGPLRAGLWFISWQTVCVGISMSFFWALQLPFVAALGLLAGVILSRVGLWGFDLSVQIIVQEVGLVSKKSSLYPFIGLTPFS